MARQDRAGAALRGALLLASFAALLLVAAQCAAQAPAVPKLDWKPCTYVPAGLPAMLCADATVPLDYKRPGRANITLSVIKYAAENPSKRVGTLFMNPGGPGGPGTADLPVWVELFPAAVRQVYDLVSWDPRGIGRSTAVQCFDTEDEKNLFLNITQFDNYYPVGPDEVWSYVRKMKGYAQACSKRNGDLLNHVSTADTARDLDLLRQAVGDAKLTYIGLSYGTFLGATYANLFPDNFRALVLDGVVDANAWFTKPGLSLSLRLNTDVATFQATDQFLKLCGAAPASRCAFSEGSWAATRTKFYKLLEVLKAKGAIGIPAGVVGREATNWQLGMVVGAMQNLLFVTSDYPLLAKFLQVLWENRDKPLVTPPPYAPTGQTSYAGDEQQWSVTCGDAPEVRSPQELIKQAAAEYPRSGYNAALQTWNGDGACLYWPGKAANGYKGPFDKNTSAPILVIGNTYDPATWYGNAVKTATLTLSNARLLTIEGGMGHTVVLNPSSCANDLISAYIINGTLPPVDATCKQDCVPFTENFTACVGGGTARRLRRHHRLF